jgi:cephalosporin hydroxylase
MTILTQNEPQEFLESRKEDITKISEDKNLLALTNKWFNHSAEHRYSYHFDWLGLPIIQYPQDMVALQEIIWKTKPDIIIETGIARGGSLIFNASILHMLNGRGKVIGIDIDIRPHNRHAIEAHPLFQRIQLIEGSSVDINILNKVKSLISKNDQVMVILDSNHTHEHVLEELKLYSPLVTKGAYLVVMDTVIEDMPENAFPNRPWGIGNNPKTAVNAFLKENKRFEIDEEIQNKLLITAAPNGYLKCVS